ncbi:MAG: AMP-binding protein, partial [Acidimicrobiales bacterium]
DSDGRPPPRPASDPAARAKLMFTSGTTGEQKGVVWSRRAEVLHGDAYAHELLPVAEGEGLYTCLPLSHVTAQGTLLAGLWRGARVAIDDRFRPFEFWSRVRAGRAVAFTFVGTILSTLAKLPEGRGDLDNPVAWALGAATPTSLWPAIEDRFGLAVVETWGQTETASGWTFPAHLPQPPGTVGRPSARVEVLVAGPDGAAPPAGELGELWLRPREPHVLLEGYLRPGVELSSAFDAEGWYHTGDLMALEDTGDLRFAGRLRDAIRRRGEMIAPAEIEEAALGHPDIVEAAAVGVPAVGDVEEEVLVAVVSRAGTSLEPAHVHRFLAGVLPSFMVPRYVRVVDALPKTATTRVQKHLIRSQGSEGSWDARPGWGRHGPRRAVGPAPGG